MGYTEQAIINAVISSMSPSVTLRTVLGTTSRQFLEANFQQQNARGLCNTMSAILQFHKETVYSFVMRCLGIRQKMILFSGKPYDLSYTPRFLNKFFLRTLERQIRIPFINQKIKHLLRADNVCDEDLLVAVMRASTYENERSDLQSRTSKKISKVHEASSSSKENSVSKLVTAIESLSFQLTSLKQYFQNLKEINVNSRNRNVLRQTFI